MGICTKCGYLTNDTIQEQHTCQDEKQVLMKGMARLIYDIAVYADPASTAGQKSNALTRIQTKRSWIEANVDKLQDFLT